MAEGPDATVPGSDEPSQKILRELRQGVVLQLPMFSLEVLQRDRRQLTGLGYFVVVGGGGILLWRHGIFLVWSYWACQKSVLLQIPNGPTVWRLHT